MKKIYLPAWVKPMAELHAESEAREVHKLNPDSKEYAKVYNKAFNEFCRELHEDSLTPKVSNPTWRGGVNAFDVFESDLFNSADSFIGKRAGDQKERADLARMLRRAITNIVNVYLKGEVKSNKYGYNQIPKDSPTKKEDLMKMQVLRFERLMFISILLSFISSLFKIKGSELEALTKAALKDRSFASLSGSKTTGLHRAFSSAIKKAIQDKVDMNEILSSIQKQFEASDFYKDYE